MLEYLEQFNCVQAIVILVHKQINFNSLTLQDKVDLGVMATKEYSTFPRAPELKPHHQMQFKAILGIHFF